MSQLCNWRLLQVNIASLEILSLLKCFCSCNRYDAQRKATLSLDHRKQEALKDYREWEKISKFLHYYERYKEHIKSYQVTEKLGYCRQFHVVCM